MKFKEMVVKVNDFVFYAGFAVICITSAIIGATSGIYGALFGIVGLLVFCMLSGAWFVLSSIADNSQRQVILTEQGNALLKKQVSLLEKIYESRTYDVNFQLDE